jgi:hypothetical protein
MEFTRLNNDVNGNPRYVVHYLACMPKSYSKANNSYALTCKLMNKIGGRKYNYKCFGGGIVFTSYNLTELEQLINELKTEVDND